MEKNKACSTILVKYLLPYLMQQKVIEINCIKLTISVVVFQPQLNCAIYFCWYWLSVTHRSSILQLRYCIQNRASWHTYLHFHWSDTNRVSHRKQTKKGKQRFKRNCLNDVKTSRFSLKIISMISLGIYNYTYFPCHTWKWWNVLKCWIASFQNPTGTYPQTTIFTNRSQMSIPLDWYSQIIWNKNKCS